MWSKMTSDWTSSGSDAAIPSSGHTKKELLVGHSSIDLGFLENIDIAVGISSLT